MLSERAGEPPARSRVRAVLVSIRPAQWTKNGVLLVAPVFAHRATDAASVVRALVAVAAFCLLASAVYVANDLADREHDRIHPVKRRRPIAAGELSVELATGLTAVLAFAGLVLAGLLGASFLAVGLGYLALQAAYTLVLRRLVIVDVFAVALGFVLRVVAGAVAVAVPISNWLYLCSLLLALFLALAKRRAEIILLAAEAPSHRHILAEYSTPLLDQLITVLSACSVLAYALYTLSPETIQKFGSDRLKFTVPFVLFGLFRYLYLVHRRGAGGQPELVLLRDRATQVNLAAYVATVLWAIYG